jgi:hypothetical protein
MAARRWDLQALATPPPERPQHHDPEAVLHHHPSLPRAVGREGGPSRQHASRYLGQKRSERLSTNLRTPETQRYVCCVDATVRFCLARSMLLLCEECIASVNRLGSLCLQAHSSEARRGTYARNAQIPFFKTLGEIYEELSDVRSEITRMHAIERPSSASASRGSDCID